MYCRFCGKMTNGNAPICEDCEKQYYPQAQATASPEPAQMPQAPDWQGPEQRPYQQTPYQQAPVQMPYQQMPYQQTPEQIPYQQPVYQPEPIPRQKTIFVPGLFSEPKAPEDDGLPVNPQEDFQPAPKEPAPPAAPPESDPAKKMQRTYSTLYVSKRNYWVVTIAAILVAFQLFSLFLPSVIKEPNGYGYYGDTETYTVVQVIQNYTDTLEDDDIDDYMHENIASDCRSGRTLSVLLIIAALSAFVIGVTKRKGSAVIHLLIASVCLSLLTHLTKSFSGSLIETLNRGVMVSQLPLGWLVRFLWVPVAGGLLAVEWEYASDEW